MSLYNQLQDRQAKIAVVGMGYVGLPLAYAFDKKGIHVIGFDIDEHKIATYKKGIDPTKEIGDTAVASSTIEYTADPTKLAEARMIIVAVPTPVDEHNAPDLSPLRGASKTVGEHIQAGSIVVYESTVFPGATEEVCVPIIESVSGLRYGEDFKVGYSPERINPGDKVHRLENTVKIVSGMDAESLDTIAKTYEIIIEAGVHRAANMQVAEAAKIVENCQRDINIAFMNEIAMMFDRLDIDTKHVLEAAGTKWNFLNFSPGLVGGHCIGIDPYYLIQRAADFGYESQIILPGRKLNDSMGEYVTNALVRQLIATNTLVTEAKIAILGITFKGNCPDTRNTKVLDIIDSLKAYGITPVVADAWADKQEVKHYYGIDLVDMDDLKDLDAIIVAVSHDEFASLGPDDVKGYYRDGVTPVLNDVRSVLDREAYEQAGFNYWRL